MIDYKWANKKNLEEKHYLSTNSGVTWDRLTLGQIGRNIIYKCYPRYKLKGQFWFEVSGCDSDECTASKSCVPHYAVHTDFIHAVSLVDDDLGYYGEEDSGYPEDALYIEIGRMFIANPDYFDRVPRSWIGVWRDEYAKLYGKKKKEEAND